MYRDKKRGRWRVPFAVMGRWRSKSFADLKEAKRFELELACGLADTSAKAGPTPTFAEFAKTWIRDYAQVEKAESQWKADEKNIARHLTPALGFRKLTDLTKAHLVRLKSDLKRKTIGKKSPRPISPKTVNNVLALAKKMLSTAVDLDLLAENPWASVKPLKVPDRKFDFWTSEELDEFSTEAMPLNPRLVRLCLVAFHTGLRAGELGALRREDLDFDRRQVCIRATLDLNRGVVYPRTKNGKVEFVPLNQDALQALEPARFLKTGEYVFHRDLFWNLRKRFGELADEVGSRPIRFHDLRHSFASNLAMAGVDLMQIQKLMRHQSYQMTLRYAHLHPAHLRGATEVLCRTRPARQETETRKSGAPRGT